MSRDDRTLRGMSGPESHLDLAVHRHPQQQQQQRQQNVEAGPGPVDSPPTGQGRYATLNLNATLELDMLRHKLRTLEAAVERHGMFMFTR